MTRTKLLLMTLCAAPVACSSAGDVNIGDTQKLGSKLSDYAASWDGYAEAHTFMPSGSDRVQLVLDGAGSGTLRLGDDPLLAPATDGSVGYPPMAATAGPPLQTAVNMPFTMRDDFLYPVHAAQVQTDRIQLGLNPLDLYATWCSLQTPVPADPSSPDSSYGCLPNSSSFNSGDGTCGLNNADGSTTPVDCGKLLLCELSNVCQCTATACAIPAIPADQAPAQYPDELDAALDSTGQNLTGTLTVNGTRVTVHLQRK
jgi:hypothetical protein